MTEFRELHPVGTGARLAQLERDVAWYHQRCFRDMLSVIRLLRLRPLRHRREFDPNDHVIAVWLDDATLEQIRERAVKSDTTVNEQIRLLLEWGLMAGEERRAA